MNEAGKERVLAIAAGELRREGIRLFRRMIEPGYYVRSLEEAPPWGGLFGPRNNWRRPVLKVDMKIVSALHRADLLMLSKGALERCQGAEVTGGRDHFTLSAVGEAWWRRHSNHSVPFQAQHQLLEEQQFVENDGGSGTHQINTGEAPLGWLSRRKGSDGRPFLSGVEVDAGEKLRRDYTFAGLSPNITANWESMLAHVDKTRSLPAERMDAPLAMLDARRRVERALLAVGPGLSEILFATCCQLSGLEAAERSLGWPQRSAKIVLKIALARLVDHYGLGAAAAPKRQGQAWHAPCEREAHLNM